MIKPTVGVSDPHLPDLLSKVLEIISQVKEPTVLQNISQNTTYRTGKYLKQEFKLKRQNLKYCDILNIKYSFEPINLKGHCRIL